MVAATIGLYIFTTICAVTFAIIGSLIYSGQYAVADDTSEDVPVPEVTLACSVDGAGNPTSFLTEMNDGSVMCAAGDPTDESLFLMEDVNGYFATSTEEGPAKMTLSESLYQGLFMQMIYPNMVGLFVDNNFLGVIVMGVSTVYHIRCVSCRADMCLNISLLLNETLQFSDCIWYCTH